MHDSSPRTTFTCPNPQLGSIHKTKIKVSVKLDSYPEALGKESPSKLIQVTGKIQFLAAIVLMSLISSWLPAGTHCPLQGSAWMPFQLSLPIVKPTTARQIPLLLQQFIRSSSFTEFCVFKDHLIRWGPPGESPIFRVRCVLYHDTIMVVTSHSQVSGQGSKGSLGAITLALLWTMGVPLPAFQ